MRKEKQNPSSQLNTESPRLRVVSYNIQNRLGEAKAERAQRMEKTAEFVQSLQPDIICMQEAYLQDFNHIKEHLNAEAVGFTPRDDGVELGEGNPIICLNRSIEYLDFQSFWLSMTPSEPSRSWRAAHRRIASMMHLSVEDHAHDLWVVNLHLDHFSRLARRNSMHLIREKLHAFMNLQHDAVLVCGDFNMGPGELRQTGFCHQNLEPTSPFPLVLEDAALDSPEARPLPTYLGFGPLGLFKRRIDYCLHSRNLECLDYQTVEPFWESVQLSDHRLVLADFLLKGNAA